MAWLSLHPLVLLESFCKLFPSQKRDEDAEKAGEPCKKTDTSPCALPTRRLTLCPVVSSQDWQWHPALCFPYKQTDTPPCALPTWWCVAWTSPPSPTHSAPPGRHGHHGRPLVGAWVVPLSTAELRGVIPASHSVDHVLVHGTAQVLPPRAHGGNRVPAVLLGVVAFHCRGKEGLWSTGLADSGYSIFGPNFHTRKMPWTCLFSLFFQRTLASLSPVSSPTQSITFRSTLKRKLAMLQIDLQQFYLWHLPSYSRKWLLQELKKKCACNCYASNQSLVFRTYCQTQHWESKNMTHNQVTGAHKPGEWIIVRQNNI